VISQAKTVLFIAVAIALLMMAIAIHPAIDLVLATTPVAFATASLFVIFAVTGRHRLSKALSNCFGCQMRLSKALTSEDLLSTICAMRC
jgi:hypothetical protein